MKINKKKYKLNDKEKLTNLSILNTKKLYYKLMETFHAARECKTGVYFRGCLVHPFAGVSGFSTIRML